MSQAEVKRGNGRGREHEEAGRPEEIERDLERTRREMSATLEELGRRLSPGEMVDQIFGYFQTGPGEFAQNLGRTLKYNPVPTALLGIGLIWLMTSGNRRAAYTYPPAREYESSLSNAGEPSLGEIGVEAGMEWRERMSEKAGETKGGLREKIAGARERFSEMRHQAAERMHEARQGAAERVHGMREGAAERSHAAGERTGAAREYLSGQAGRARERAGRMAQQMRRGGSRARESWERSWEEQPLVMGALGLAAGALLGALLPPSRREDQLLGESRDRMMEEASGAAGEAMGRAGAVAERAAGSAREEAGRQWQESSYEAGAPGQSAGAAGSGGEEPQTGESTVVTVESRELPPTRH